MQVQFRLNYAEMEHAQPGLPDRFALLGLFPLEYSFTQAEMAATWGLAAADGAGIRSVSIRLVERGLIERVPGAAQFFRMPPVVHRLAGAYLDEHPALKTAGRPRLIDYYAARAAALADGRPESLTEIADISDAAATALAWAEQDGRPTDVVALARALCLFYYARGMSSQYRVAVRRGLHAARQARQPRQVAWFLREQAGLAADTGQFEDAVGLFEGSIAIYRELGDEHGEAQGLYEWGRAEAARGRHETARHLINESMDIMRELHHGVLQPATLHDLADLSIKQGLPAQAQRELQEALNAEIDRDDRAAQAHTLYELGELASNRGQGQEAAGYYMRSLALARQEHDRRQGGLTLAALGLQAALAGDARTATRCWLAALGLLRAAGAPEAAEVDQALSRHLGAARVKVPPEATQRALAEWWGA